MNVHAPHNHYRSVGTSPRENRGLCCAVRSTGRESVPCIAVSDREAGPWNLPEPPCFLGNRDARVARCRCEVCDYDQDDGRKTVSEQGVQRVTSKSKKETAQTQAQGPLRQTNTGAHESLTKRHRVRKTSARGNARQVPKTHKTNTTNVCAQLLTQGLASGASHPLIDELIKGGSEQSVPLSRHRFCIELQ